MMRIIELVRGDDKQPNKAIKSKRSGLCDDCDHFDVVVAVGGGVAAAAEVNYSKTITTETGSNFDPNDYDLIDIDIISLDNDSDGDGNGDGDGDGEERLREQINRNDSIDINLIRSKPFISNHIPMDSDSINRIQSSSSSSSILLSSRTSSMLAIKYPNSLESNPNQTDSNESFDCNGDKIAATDYQSSNTEHNHCAWNRRDDDSNQSLDFINFDKFNRQISGPTNNVLALFHSKNLDQFLLDVNADAVDNDDNDDDDDINVHKRSSFEQKTTPDKIGERDDDSHHFSLWSKSSKKILSNSDSDNLKDYFISFYSNLSTNKIKSSSPSSIDDSLIVNCSKTTDNNDDIDLNVDENDKEIESIDCDFVTPNEDFVIVSITSIGSNEKFYQKTEKINEDLKDRNRLQHNFESDRKFESITFDSSPETSRQTLNSAMRTTINNVVAEIHSNPCGSSLMTIDTINSNVENEDEDDEDDGLATLNSSPTNLVTLNYEQLKKSNQLYSSSSAASSTTTTTSKNSSSSSLDSLLNLIDDRVEDGIDNQTNPNDYVGNEIEEKKQQLNYLLNFTTNALIKNGCDDGCYRSKSSKLFSSSSRAQTSMFKTNQNYRFDDDDDDDPGRPLLNGYSNRNKHLFSMSSSLSSSTSSPPLLSQSASRTRSRSKSISILNDQHRFGSNRFERNRDSFDWNLHHHHHHHHHQYQNPQYPSNNQHHRKSIDKNRYWIERVSEPFKRNDPNESVRSERKDFILDQNNRQNNHLIKSIDQCCCVASQNYHHHHQYHHNHQKQHLEKRNRFNQIDRNHCVRRQNSSAIMNLEYENQVPMKILSTNITNDNITSDEVDRQNQNDATNTMGNEIKQFSSKEFDLDRKNYPHQSHHQHQHRNYPHQHQHQHHQHQHQHSHQNQQHHHHHSHPHHHIHQRNRQRHKSSPYDRGCEEDGKTFTKNDHHSCTRRKESRISIDDNENNSNGIIVNFPKLKYLKISLLSLLVIYTLISFIFIQEKKENWTNVAMHDKLPAYIDLSQSFDLMFPVWKLRARGAFLPREYRHLTNYSIIFTIVQLLNETNSNPQQQSYRVVKRPWAVPIAPTNIDQNIPIKEIEHTFKLTRGDVFDQNYHYRLRIDTNSKESIGITLTMSGFSELSADGIILAASVLIFLYILIIFEIVNRTLAAMLGATAAITCLTLIRDRPSLAKVVSWLDVETLSLLFGMMILVAILCETGFFDYVAVVAFRLAKGRTWPLIFTLCFFTGVMSAFLDNVTTILLMTPVTIRLCEIKNIEPKHVLISLVIISNIGGAATPVGDPPNVIIISSASIQQQGINFGRFTLHMFPGIIISFLATLCYIRIYYRDIAKFEFQDSTNDDGTKKNQNDDFQQSYMQTNFAIESDDFTENNNYLDDSGFQNRLSKYEHQEQQQSNVFDDRVSLERGEINLAMTTIADEEEQTKSSCSNIDNLSSIDDSYQEHLWNERRVFRSSDELKREIEVWKRACNSIVGYSRDENSVRAVLNRKVETLETILQQHCYETVPPEDNYRSVLNELEQKYKIQDWPLLIKSIMVMSMVITLFFLQSIPNLDLSLGWIAIFGSILLLVLSDRHELESILGRVEWSTLIFFAALFVVMEALAELKFLWWIGQLTQDFINSVPEESRLIVAILVFIWISALSSSFIDNIPLTTVMVKIIEDLAENNEFNIPLVPLIYALAFGACLGGNGTLIGASSNVVCSGVAEQHGYRFTFLDFFRIGFPIMLMTVAISTVYLIICHVVFQWNY